MNFFSPCDNLSMNQILYVQGFDWQKMLTPWWWWCWISICQNLERIDKEEKEVLNFMEQRFEKTLLWFVSSPQNMTIKNIDDMVTVWRLIQKLCSYFAFVKIEGSFGVLKQFSLHYFQILVWTKMFFKEFTLAIFIFILQNLDASCGAKIRPFLSTHRYRQSVFDPSSFSHTMTLGMNWRNFHCNFISCAYNNFYQVKKAHSQDHNISLTV